MLKYLFVLLLCSASVFAKQTKVSVAAPEIYPFVFLDEQNQPQGLLVDCLKRNKNPDYTYNVFVYPWARALKEVKKNRIDALMPTNLTKQRQQFLAYPKKPLLSFANNVLAQKKQNSFVDFESASLNNKIIAKVRSTFIGDALNEQMAFNNISLFEVNDFTTGIAMLQQGRIDYLLGDYQIIKHSAKKINVLNQLEFIPLSEDKAPSYFAFSKQFAQQHNINKLMDGLDCQSNIN